MNEERLKEIARWYEAEVITNPLYQDYYNLINDKLTEQSIAVCKSADEKTHERGRIAGRLEQLRDIHELIKVHGIRGTVDDTTDTSTKT